MSKRTRKLSETQIETLCELRGAGIRRDREGVSVATVGALKGLGLVSLYPVLHEVLNEFTGRVNRRAGWMVDITPKGERVADDILYRASLRDEQSTANAAWLGR